MAFLGFGKDPAAEAGKYLNQIPDVLKQYLEPFINRSGQAGDILQEQYGQLSQDPTGMLNKLMEQYEPSKGYQFQKEQMGQSAANTAAAGGLRGSPQEQAEQQRITQGLLSQDMQSWLKNAMGLQSEGLQGEAGLYGTGASASSDLASSLANLLGTQGSLAFQGAQQNNWLPQLLGAGAGGLGFLGGLPVAGGGSLLGNWLSGQLGGQ